ncbi:hypothetical protein [Rhizobium oryzicola]|uniref:Uncharacterized protein n=1 Tax=Rhizobium oryzicola TaxID=1232668 RepID=A0ABT8SUE2_9HYPH|nr:hypothetical protein [Rhizobium oryzicola]MDO1582045.1 hypothetical protein [Rhizobium oryzicola]
MSDDNQDTYGLPSSVSQAVSAAENQSQPANTAIDSVAFMQGLKAKISDMSKDPNTKDQADQMMKALQNGTLTITDAETGQQVKAWDPGSKTATPQRATSTPKTDWGSFLRDHLTRESGGRYVRDASGSNIERSTGNSAYFGTLNDNYYYMTWKPQA